MAVLERRAQPELQAVRRRVPHENEVSSEAGQDEAEGKKEGKRKKNT